MLFDLFFQPCDMYGFYLRFSQNFRQTAAGLRSCRSTNDSFEDIQGVKLAILFKWFHVIKKQCHKNEQNYYSSK